MRDGRLLVVIEEHTVKLHRMYTNLANLKAHKFVHIYQLYGLLLAIFTLPKKFCQEKLNILQIVEPKSMEIVRGERVQSCTGCVIWVVSVSECRFWESMVELRRSRVTVECKHTQTNAQERKLI